MKAPSNCQVAYEIIERHQPITGLEFRHFARTKGMERQLVKALSHVSELGLIHRQPWLVACSMSRLRARPWVVTP